MVWGKLAGVALGSVAAGRFWPVGGNVQAKGEWVAQGSDLSVCEEYVGGIEPRVRAGITNDRAVPRGAGPLFRRGPFRRIVVTIPRPAGGDTGGHVRHGGRTGRWNDGRPRGLHVLLSFKSQRFKQIADGRPSVVLSDGRPHEDILTRERLTVDDVIEAAREQGISDLRDLTEGVHLRCFRMGCGLTP